MTPHAAISVAALLKGNLIVAKLNNRNDQYGSYNEERCIIIGALQRRSSMTGNRQNTAQKFPTQLCALTVWITQSKQIVCNLLSRMFSFGKLSFDQIWSVQKKT